MRIQFKVRLLTTSVLLALLGLGASLPAAGQESTPGKFFPLPNRPGTDQARDKAPFLGVSVAEVDETLRTHLELPFGAGLLVQSVQPDSPAAQAGLERHDILLKLDDQLLVNSAQLTTLVRARRKGDTVTIEIIRAGAPKQVEVALGERELPPPEPFFHRFPPLEFPQLERYFHELPGMSHELKLRFQGPIRHVGVTVKPIAKELAAQLALEQPHGLEVAHVHKESPAAQAGIKPGDILLELNETKLVAPEDLLDTVQPFEKGDSVQLKLIRDGAAKKIEVVLDEKPSLHLSELAERLREKIEPFYEDLRQDFQDGPLPELWKNREEGLKELRRRFDERRLQSPRPPGGI